MSDLAAAAAALGVPEALVQRSAAARAAETGMTVDEVLAAWAGGGSAPAAPMPAAAESGAAAEETTPVEEETTVSEEVASPSEAPPVPAEPQVPLPGGGTRTTVSGRPPVLVGKTDNPVAVFAGAIGLFLAVFLVGLVGPSLPADSPGARSSELPYTATAEMGRHVYESVGCGSCHTQMVRPIVADVGLGGVTLNDSNQVLGTRRFGPDLSDAGSRLSGSQIEATITGLGGHPAISLSQQDLEVLVAYLVESKTLVEPPPSTATTVPASEDETG